MSKYQSPLFRNKLLYKNSDSKFGKSEKVWKAGHAYSFDGSTTYGLASITDLTGASAQGFEIALWVSHDNTVTAINMANMSNGGGPPNQQVFPGASPYRMRSRYADENGAITPSATAATAPTPDTNDYVLYTIWQEPGTPCVPGISYVYPGGENVGTTAQQAGQIVSENFNLISLGGNHSGAQKLACIVVCFAVFIGNLTSDDRAALFNNGIVKDWRIVTAERNLDMVYYYRLGNLYQVPSGEIYCPNDGSRSDGVMEIINGDFSDLVTQIPTGVV